MSKQPSIYIHHRTKVELKYRILIYVNRTTKMFKPNPDNTAIVITDPQNDLLSPGGKGYHLTKNIIEHYNTLGNLEILISTAMSKGYQLFISPHYIYPHDYSWQFTGAEQEMLLKLR